MFVIYKPGVRMAQPPNCYLEYDSDEPIFAIYKPGVRMAQSTNYTIQGDNIETLCNSIATAVPQDLTVTRAIAENIAQAFTVTFKLFAARHNGYSVSQKLDEHEIETIG